MPTKVMAEKILTKLVQHADDNLPVTEYDAKLGHSCQHG